MIIRGKFAVIGFSWETEDTTAKYNTAYTAKVTFALPDSENYCFADSVTATENGAEATAKTGENGLYIVSYTFPKTAQPALTGIKVTLPEYVEYIIGESINVTGGKLTLTYEDGSTENIDLTADMLDYDNTTAGTVTVTVNYGNFTDTFDVTFTKKSSGGGSSDVGEGSSRPTTLTSTDPSIGGSAKS